MKHLDTYRIPFQGLALGKHEFEFDVDKRFFDCYEYSIVKDGQLKARVLLEKQETMLIVHVDMEGTIHLKCDVCLREFDRQTKLDMRLLIKFSDAEYTAEDVDEVLMLDRKEHQFSIANVLYEHINVSVPYYIRCNAQTDGGGCDEDMVRLLQQMTPKENPEDQLDPRWAELEKLKRNN